MRAFRPARRLLHSTCRKSDLFGGGGKTLSSYKLSDLTPGGKAESTPNPVDLFKKNDIFLLSQKPANNIESVRSNGFLLSNKIFISSPNKEGDIIGALLVDADAYEVNLSKNGFYITKDFLVEFDHESVLQIFGKIHPKPEILVVGTGKKSRMLSEPNRKYLSSLGIQLEVCDSTIAAQLFDMLATERPNLVGALLLPPNV